MTIDFDSARIELTCPGCGQKFPETIGKLKTNPALECPGCHKTINVKAEQLAAGIQQAQDALADLARSIRNFGKS